MDFSIPDEYVEKFCKPGRGAETCRYLLMGKGGWECAKDSEFQELVEKNFEKGIMVARGDNCAGITNVTGVA